jgi:hypothetical protein
VRRRKIGFVEGDPHRSRPGVPMRSRVRNGMWRAAEANLAVLGIGERGSDAAEPVAGSARSRVAASRRSPFRPGTPLYAGDLLPGDSRRQLVATISADLVGGTNVNLVGERRLGRTTTLNHAWARLAAEDGCVVARVNMQDDVLTPEDFYGAVLAAAARSPLGAQLLGGERIGRLQHERRLSYRELRDALGELRAHAAVIVLVDEFERCFDLADAFAMPVFYDNLRSLLGGDEQGAYMTAAITSREALTVYFKRRQVTSSLPGYLPPRTMELLTDGDIEETLAQDSPHRLGPAQREHAAALAACHPCRVQCAGEAWYRALGAGHGREWAEREYARLSEHVCGSAAIGDSAIEP